MQVTSDEVFAELSASFDAATVDDPYEIFAEKRRTAPVWRGDILAELGVPSFSGTDTERPVYSLFSYEHVAAALRDHEAFSSAIWLETFGPLAGRVVLGLDGEEHRSWRGLMLPIFTRKAVVNWEDTVVRPIIERAVAELAPDKQADLVGFAQRFPVDVIYEIIGLEGDESFFERFQVLAVLMLLGLAVDADPSNVDRMMQRYGRAMEASQELYELVRPIVESRRAAGADGADLISHLINAEYEGDRLDDDQVTNFIRALLVAATENTSRQFLITASILFGDPALLDRVRADRSLLQKAVIEAQRFDAPFGTVPRVTTREIEIGGVTLPAGAAVLLMLGSANRDEAAFPEPDTFDLTRSGRTPLTFGLGRHVCPGMNIATVQVVVALETLLDRLPGLRLDPAVEPSRVRGVNVRGPGRVDVNWD